STQLSSTSFWRTGNVKNGLFPASSFGDSEKQNFINYAVKGGATYKINGRNFIVGNAGYLTKAPEFNDAFVSIRTRDQLANNLDSEKIFSTEGGYLLKAPKMKVKAFAYLTEFENQTKTMSFYHGDYRTFVNYTLTGINTRHVGTELAAEFNIYKGVTVNGVAALGQYFYTSRPTATVSADNSAELLQSDQTIYIENFRVAGTPQNAYSVGLGYRAPQFWFINLSFNYFDQIWLEFNPTRRTIDAVDLLDTDSDQFENIIRQQQLDSQFTVDFFGGKSWKLNNHFKGLKGNSFLVLNLGVNNLLNNKEFITGGFEQLRFDFQEQNPNSFAPKYFYGFGTNFFANITLRFN
ncbi:MAG: TonB-dependent receptor, partial [Nitrosopumilus sp.]|nr:TonB-dependent receptor [Nitrosopumilus sp.]